MNLLNLVNFELRKLAISKSTWILLAIFVCLANISTFFLGGFLVLNQASLMAFLKFAPIYIALFAFLVSFNSNTKDSKKANNIKIASLPISLKKLTLAKYIANLILGVIFLILSSSIVVTIGYLGQPDWLLTFAGLLACFLFFMLCFSITSFTSTFARSSFESLGLSILIIFILCLTGFGAVSTMLEIILPSAFVLGLTKYSILTSFSNMASGYLGFNDIVLYVSLIAFFLSLSLLFANKNIYKIRYAKAKVLIAMLALGLVNVSFYNSSAKLDLTSDKIYSISENTINLLHKIKSPAVEVTFYYSENNPSIPLEFARMAEYTNRFLTELEKSSNGKIRYTMKNPESSEVIEIDALRDRTAEIPLANGDSMYMGISLKHANQTYSIPAVSVLRKSFLEYDIAHLLVNFLPKSHKKRIGILTDMDLGNQETAPAFIQELLKRYDMDLIPMSYPLYPDYDLVIAFVSPFTEPNALYATDQYLVRGGKMLLLLDPFFRTAPEDDFLMPDRKADDSAFDHLADLLRYYGVNYDYNSIVGDTSRAMSTELPGVGVTSYPLWVLFSEANMNKTNPIFANLNNIIIPEGGFFDPFDVIPSLTYTPLLTTTSNSQVVSRALFSTLGDAKAVASRLRGDKKPRDVSFMLDGNFESAFKRRPEAVTEWFKYAESIEEAKIPKHQLTTDKKGALIAIADMDFISDNFSTYGEKNLDGSITKKPISDNQYFLTNTIDYLMNDYDLIALRGKGDALRTLEKVENLIVDDIAKQEFQENALVRTIELNAQQYKNMNERLKLAKTPEQYMQIKQIIASKQQELVQAKRSLKVYKRSLQESVENYIRKIALINVLFAPVILLLLGTAFFLRRKFKKYKI